MEAISKEELEEIKRIKGKGRGVVFKPIFEFILEHEGKEGLKRLEDFLEKVGFSLKNNEIRSMDLYPLKKKAALFIAISKLFGYSEQDFKKMGREAAHFPLLVRRLVKLFPADRLLKDADRVWKLFFTTGEIEVVEFDRKKRLEIERLRDFSVHPLECKFLTGYSAALRQLLLKKEVVCEETKCIHRGDEYHEFVFRW
jgi:predicted hydrocarbon binding protein